MKLLEIAVKPSDVKDALQVLKDWSFEYRVRWNEANVDEEFKKALTASKIEKLPVASLKPHHDWGRRPKSDDPIIVARFADSKLIVLDGQHRLITAKEAGKESISARVLELPLQYSKPLKRYAYRKDAP